MLLFYYLFSSSYIYFLRFLEIFLNLQDITVEKKKIILYQIFQGHRRSREVWIHDEGLL